MQRRILAYRAWQTPAISSVLRTSQCAHLHVGADHTHTNAPTGHAGAGTPTHIDSYYSRSLCPQTAKSYPELRGAVDTDVVVLGGGLAGVNVAHALASRGVRVCVLEARRVGWAASGRNGGFAHPGYSLDMFSLAKAVGKDHMRELWGLTFKSLEMIRARIQRWSAEDATAPAGSRTGSPAAAEAVGPLQPGMLVASWFDTPQETRAEVDAGNQLLGQDYFQFWSRERVRNTYATNKYYDGLYDPASFHFHSLNYAAGVANEATQRGAQIYEGTPALRIVDQGGEKRISTPRGVVRAAHVVVCGSAYMPEMPGGDAITRAVLPVMTYACATEPLGDRLQDVMKGPHAVTDSRFACDYYRPLPDTRILWGGRIDCLGIHPDKLATTLRGDMCKVYPQLKTAKVDVAWSGVMGYARHKMPLIGKLAGQEGIWYCTGFGGHGVCPTTVAGELIGSAIAEDSREYKLFEPFGLEWTGGPVLGAIGAQAFYWAYQARDIIKASRVNKS